MRSLLSKTEAKEKIEEFFKNLKEKKPEQIKKIKRLAMHYHISLNQYKRLYCKKCYSVFNSLNSETRIKKRFKTIKCKNCGNIKIYKLKS